MAAAFRARELMTRRVACVFPWDAIFGMACDEGVLPLDERVAADEAELDDIYETERRLLYVACTRAREHPLLTGVTPACSRSSFRGAREARTRNLEILRCAPWFIAEPVIGRRKSADSLAMPRM